MSYTTTQRKQLAQQWEAKLLDQKNSGLSIPAYCREKGITLSTFHYWKRKLRSNRTLLSPSKFVQVNPRFSSSLASRLILSPNMILETSGLPDPAWLCELVEQRLKGGVSC